MEFERKIFELDRNVTVHDRFHTLRNKSVR